MQILRILAGTALTVMFTLGMLALLYLEWLPELIEKYL